jgi:type IVB pilus formation R64 PilN family outer membrane protein
MNKPVLHLSIIATALLATGCVSTKITDNTRASITAARATADLTLASSVAPASTRAAYEKSQEVDAPWIVGKSVPLARSVALPAALQKDVKTAIMFDQSWVSLAAAAERIMLATGMVVTINPDVYLDSAALQRKAVKDTTGGSTANSGQPAFAAMPVGMPVAPTVAPVPLPLPSAYGQAPATAPVASGGAGKGQRPPESANGFDFPRVNAPLSQVLDIIATKLGIKWKYDEASNSIRFYRMITKTWETPFMVSKANYKSALEGETTASTNQNVVAARNTTAPINDELKDLVELTSMRDSLETVMTRSGQAFANPATGAITLTDTPDAVDAADEIIKNGIKTLSRIVRMRMQTIKVSSKNSGEAGFDMSAVVARALQNLPDFRVVTSSPASINSTSAGAIRTQVYSGSAAGSSAMITALQDIGDVEVSNEIPLSTRNRRGVTYSVRNTFSYVASTTPAAATTGGTGGTPGITTAQDTVGLKLFLVPEVNRDTVTVNISLDQSTLKSLETFTSGSGASAQSVQLPNKDGEGSSQVVPIRNGQTILLTGFDTKSNQYDKRTMGANIPIVAGGGLRATESRSTTIVLMTAEVVDGAVD